MGSKFFGNKNDNRETNGKRLFKSKKSKSVNKISSNSNSKAKSKGFVNPGSSGVRKVGRGG
ncbi:MAG: hypothetical protein ISQ43_04595 [Flavobacteriaceae bacterium]|nr:hypothetical protein [Flavobacteriaceae bacterium]